MHDGRPIVAMAVPRSPPSENRRQGWHPGEARFLSPTSASSASGRLFPDACVVRRRSPRDPPICRYRAPDARRFCFHPRTMRQSRVTDGSSASIRPTSSARATTQLLDQQTGRRSAGGAQGFRCAPPVLADGTVFFENGKTAVAVASRGRAALRIRRGSFDDSPEIVTAPEPNQTPLRWRGR